MISQIYSGGGGMSGSPTFNQDYVELFNRSATAQAIGGFTIQFGASASTGNFTPSAVIPAGTIIPAGGYYLIGLVTGTVGSSLSPTPNFTSVSVSLATASGKVALVTNGTALSGTSPATGPTVLDFVGYGAANAYEGSGPTGTALTLTTAAFRASGGCTDINQNSFDFGVGPPAPRNAGTTAAPCAPPATITTLNPSPAAVCATGTSTLAVPYTVVTGAAGPYLVQLSDAMGSFNAPLTLASSTTSSPLVVTIPATVAGGTGYLVRAVVGGNFGSSNPTAFTINNVSVAPTADQTLVTNTSGAALTATETPAGTSRQWYYSTTSGSGYTTAINGATGTSYTPGFAAAGTYYVVVQTNFGTCSVVSNEVKVTVTAPTITTGTVAAGPYCVGQGAPAAVSIPFTVSSAFAPGNVFTAYLSSAFNGFTTIKIPIGTLSGTGSGTIVGTIAQTTGLTTRTDYRIRVEASSPAAIGTDNGTNLSVASYLDNEVASSNAIAGNTRATLTFTSPTTCATNVVVTINAGLPTSRKPSAGGTYTPGTGGSTVVLGTGTALGSGQYVVYNGPATGSITVTGLTNGSRYTFTMFTTNGGTTGTTGYSDGSTASVIPVVPASLAEVVVPQYLSGHAAGSSTHPTRLPYVWRVSLGNLAPGTTYKYYTAVRAATDAANNDGAGIPIETQTAGAFVRKNGPSLNNSSSTFTTDAAGAYTGWFGLEPSPDARYNDQAVVYPMVVLNNGDGSNIPVQFLATTSPVMALNLSSATTGATGVRGSSFGTAGNLILTYDNVAGTGRPLAGTWIENDGLASASTGTALLLTQPFTPMQSMARPGPTACSRLMPMPAAFGASSSAPSPMAALWAARPPAPPAPGRAARPRLTRAAALLRWYSLAATRRWLRQCSAVSVPALSGRARLSPSRAAALCPLLRSFSRRAVAWWPLR